MSTFKKGDKAEITSSDWAGEWEKGAVCVVIGMWQDSAYVVVTGRDGNTGHIMERDLKLTSTNVFELKGYTEGGMYVDHRFVSGPDEAKEYIEGTNGPSNAVHYKLFEHVPAAEFKVSSVTTRTVAQV